MKSRLICILLVTPICLSYGVEFDEKHKKAECVIRVISMVCLMLLAFYLGIVLPE